MQKSQNTAVICFDNEGLIYKDDILKEYSQVFNFIVIEPIEQDKDRFDTFERFTNKVKENQNNLGICVTGEGTLATIILNKTFGIRACFCSTYYLAGMTRKHNDANILVISTVSTGKQTAITFIKPFLTQEFDCNKDNQKHKKRVDKIMQIEKCGYCDINK